MYAHGKPARRVPTCAPWHNPGGLEVALSSSGQGGRSPSAGSLLLLYALSDDQASWIQAAFRVVWNGRIARQLPEDPAVDPPAIAVIAGQTPEGAAGAARSVAEELPDVPVLAVVQEIGPTRRRDDMSGITWAVTPDELDPRVLPMVMRFAIETKARRRLERELRPLRVLAEVGQIAAAQQHEIRSPLTFVLTNLEHVRGELGRCLHEQNEPDLEDLLGAVRDACAGAHLLQSITRDLSLVARQSSDVGASGTREAVESAIRLAGPRIRGRASVRRRLSVVPPILGNTGKLCQVVLNLVVNAADAFESADPAVNEIEVTLRAAASRVRVQVKDNGPGIAPAALRTLFVPWVTTKATGFGLGLALCKEFVEQMGGVLSVDSIVGQGSTFTVEVPASATTRRTPTLVPDGSLPDARILVVDDERLIGRAFQRALSAARDVVAVTSADEALDEIEKDPFDLLFLDVHMPGRSGKELFVELEQRWPEQAERVVFVSGTYGPEDVQFFRERGVHWLRKPLGADAVRACALDRLSHR